MATIAEILTSAAVGSLFGLLGGVASTIVNERLKSDVAQLEADLLRAEQFEDDLLDALGLPADATDRSSLLRRLTTARRRLGVNVRQKVQNSVDYARCEADLVRMTNFLGRAEDGELLTPELEAEIQGVLRDFRSNLKRSTSATPAFKAFRS